MRDRRDASSAYSAPPSSFTASAPPSLTSVAQARSAYDGPWDLVFVTQRGACDPSYNFSVNITDGIVTHPNLVKFKGYVARSGAVHASVAVRVEQSSDEITRELGDDRLLPWLEDDLPQVFLAGPCCGNRHGQCRE